MLIKKEMNCLFLICQYYENEKLKISLVFIESRNTDILFDLF